MFAELFISSHLPFICLLALKSLTKCAKKFPERNPNNPFLIKYTSSKQSPSVKLHSLFCSAASSAVFSLLQKSVFPFLCKIILKMNQFRKTDEMEGILHRDDQSNVFYHVHKYFIHKTLWKIFIPLDSGPKESSK